MRAFAAIRDVHREGGIPWEWVSDGDPIPRGMRPQRTEEHQRTYSQNLIREATLMSLAATALPKKRGAKKKHTDRQLLDLMLCVEELRAASPGKTDYKVIEEHLKRSYREQGKRESRVLSTAVQAEIKTILNLLGIARKRLGKPRR